MAATLAASAAAEPSSPTTMRRMANGDALIATSAKMAEMAGGEHPG